MPSTGAAVPVEPWAMKIARRAPFPTVQVRDGSVVPVGVPAVTEEAWVVGCASKTTLPEALVVTLTAVAPVLVRIAAVAPLYVPAAIEEANRTKTCVLLATEVAEELKPVVELVVEISYPD